ncbi:flagellar brake protein [Virgibacillus sp. W0430]|uniref:flagellar brake protein n=1 Tax=Virgibacillus sp. W0430 TaxID=3391580 RepID=UPI003F4756B1
MKVGTVLTVEINHSKLRSPVRCRSRVIDCNERYLFIDLPVHIHTQKTVYLTKGDRVSITFVGNDQAVYQFYSTIEERITLRVHGYKIPSPQRENLKRIQRRQYVRIETSVDVAIHCPNKNIDPFTTVTRDISGGGLSIVVPQQSKLKIDQKLELWITFRLQSGKFIYLNIEAIVINVKTEENIHLAALKFTSITQKERQHIIFYCFEKQREARKKELI